MNEQQSLAEWEYVLDLADERERRSSMSERIEIHVETAAEAEEAIRSAGDQGAEWRGVIEDDCTIAEVETATGTVRLIAPSPERAAAIWSEIF